MSASGLVPVMPDYDDADTADNPHGWGHAGSSTDNLDWPTRGAEATCGPYRGTPTGRTRHRRAGEPPCGSCMTGASNSNASRPARLPADRMAGCIEDVRGFG